MNTSFRLAISNKIEFPVHLRLQDVAGAKDFKFHLMARRIDDNELREQVTPGTQNGDKEVSEVLKGIVEGWRDQRLVIDEDGKPAEFGPESFGAMLKVVGAGTLIYQSYLKALLVTPGADRAVSKGVA